MNGYPELITINDENYEINTDYRYALACFACISDPDLSNVERGYGVIGLLYKQEPTDMAEALRMAIKYLRCGKEEPQDDESADMDFEADENYIKSSFMSDYKIDLDEVDMHWWKFCNLLQGLTDDAILNRIRDIRNYDIATIKDPKAKSKMLKAKREVALKKELPAEDQDILDDFYAQLT
jgi:hypothetical protein